MKKLFPIFASIAFLSACGTVSAQQRNPQGENKNAENTDKSGGVSVSFDYRRTRTIASNQTALWIENEKGENIRTLYVSNFTGRRRGYRNRPDSLKNWAGSAFPDSMNDTEIDAISSATLGNGRQDFFWNLTDKDGKEVPDGIYYVKLEGTLYWTSNVLYTGKIDTRNGSQSEIQVEEKRSENGNSQNENMIQNVRMTFSARNENREAKDNTKNWLGGLSPEKALSYMKENYDEGLVVVEVNTDYWKLKNGFKGALHIPHDQMAERFGEIPEGVPVILHCGAGVVSVPAYETLKEKRPDIPVLSYIAGRPPVSEFNGWLSEHKE